MVLRVSFLRIYHFIVMFVRLLICMMLYKYTIISCLNSEQSSLSIDFSPQGSSMRRCGHCGVDVLGCCQTHRACRRVAASAAAAAESSEGAAGGRGARVP